VFPLRDDIPSRRPPVVTYAVIAANVLIFFYETQLGGDLESFIHDFGLVPVHFRAAHGAERWIPVFTSMFLHGGLLHLLGNMLYLHIFGDNVEDRLGHLRFLFFYLLCGVAAALGQVLLAPGSRLPMVGASGAIAGVTGAYFVFFRHARILTIVPIFFYAELVQIPAVVFLVFWFVMQLAYGAASLGMQGAEMGGVAWWAHIGGFLCGIVAGRALAPPPRPETARWTS
jgi:membrane associated rhomboid family serine protease